MLASLAGAKDGLLGTLSSGAPPEAASSAPRADGRRREAVSAPPAAETDLRWRLRQGFEPSPDVLAASETRDDADHHPGEREQAPEDALSELSGDRAQITALMTKLTTMAVRRP